MLFLRYLFLILLALPGLYFFYLIFTPATIYPVYWILSLFYDISLQNSSFLIGDYAIEIIPACIAGSAYYLLFILNFATPMSVKIRMKSLSFLIFSFLLFNIIRLAVFSSLLVEDFNYFDLAHKAVWYFGSTIFVVLLWFASIYLFNIKEIPAYTDIMNLYSEANRAKSKR